MAIRYFTREEVDDLLPEIEPLVGRLLERRAKVARVGQQIDDRLTDLHTDFANPESTQLAYEFEVIEELVDQIQSYGCVVKSLEVGLVDFLSDMNGRDVYLCWRYGEPQISYYHDIHAGFQDRRPLD
ncbi:MAG: DUF2203 domain-containing protein [Chloroflexota bacterium]